MRLLNQQGLLSLFKKTFFLQSYVSFDLRETHIIYKIKYLPSHPPRGYGTPLLILLSEPIHRHHQNSGTRQLLVQSNNLVQSTPSLLEEAQNVIANYVIARNNFCNLFHHFKTQQLPFMNSSSSLSCSNIGPSISEQFGRIRRHFPGAVSWYL